MRCRVSKIINLAKAFSGLVLGSLKALVSQVTVSFCIRINPFSLVLSKLRTALLGSIFTFGLRRKQERESIRNLVFVDTADVEFSTIDFEIIGTL